MNKKPFIILVDDDPEVREIFVELLEEEFRVETLCDWSYLNKYIYKQDVPDIILIDINIPGVNGDKIVPILNSIKNKKFKILLFSGMDIQDLLKKVRECGADGYIQKIFTRDLIDEIKRFL